ncbi:MAG: hypothetical protein J6T65_08750, partial [Clostridia bacterium]|nr:hypothetical protein [Clostridia bacterium]
AVRFYIILKKKRNVNTITYKIGAQYQKQTADFASKVTISLEKCFTTRYSTSWMFPFVLPRMHFKRIEKERMDSVRQIVPNALQRCYFFLFILTMKPLGRSVVRQESRTLQAFTTDRRHTCRIKKPAQNAAGISSQI